MVLYPLEFSDCYLDSPWFRENIQQYEEELERTNSQIKQLIKDARNMLNAFHNHEKTIKVFSASLRNFEFDCIGDNLTDNERGIAGSLSEFGIMLETVAEEWSYTLERLEIQLIPPLESFRKQQICSYREPKKLFEKASERYYKQLENTLGLSHKRKAAQQLNEADSELTNLRKNFHQEALNYVNTLHEVEERKKFEFVEHLLMFMQVYFNYFHQTHEIAVDSKHYMNILQSQLVSTRGQYDNTRNKTETLMRKMTDNPESEGSALQALGNHWHRSGYLLLMEKNLITARLTSKWSKYFCMYNKDSKAFRMILAPHASFNAVGAKATSLNIQSSNANNPYFETMTVKLCSRRMTESMERRFCFDLEMEDGNGKQVTATLQATSLEDRKKWVSVMDGKEPEYVTTKVMTNKEDLCKLNEIGLQFVINVIAEIEKRGLEHEGIYRLVGISSKVDLLLQNALTPKTAPSVNYSNASDWETNTLTSALKSYFRNLPEPIMTFDLHRNFINAAKCENPKDRVQKVADLINQLPEANKKVLSLLAAHLGNVQQHSEVNKMTIQNLGVCFGPTLLREQQETVQAILEIKFSNIIVEIVTEESEFIFGGGDSTKKGENNSKPNLVKLPSQKLKERPVGIVYSMTTLPNILESEEAAKPSDKSRFSRLGAVRGHSKQSIPNTQNSNDASSISSDENAYEEINVGKPSNTTDVDIKQKIAMSLAKKSSKKDSSSNGNVKPSKTSKSQTMFKKPLLARNKSLEGTEPSKFAPKMRISPQQLRRNLKSPPPEQESENSNNSNIRPIVALKPKSIVRETVKSGNKLPMTMNDTLNVPKPVAKNNKKNLYESDLSGKVQRSKSTGSDLMTQAAARRRPRSDFIPAAFRTEELGQNRVSKPEVAKNSRLKTQLPSSNPVSPARSLSPNCASSEDSLSDSDVTDDDVTSEMARTLYDCKGGDEKELSFQAGQIIRDITTSNEPGWVWGSLNGKRGLVPRNYIGFF